MSFLCNFIKYTETVYLLALEEVAKAKTAMVKEIHSTATAPQHCLLGSGVQQVQVSGSSFNLTLTTNSELDIYTKSVRPVQMFKQ